jgi:hypothetical protein
MTQRPSRSSSTFRESPFGPVQRGTENYHRDVSKSIDPSRVNRSAESGLRKSGVVHSGQRHVLMTDREVARAAGLGAY